jgi:RHS repeat-associated protein
MAATAEERIPALTTSAENFSLAVPFAAFTSEHRIGANAVRGQKTHQGIFSTNRALYVSAMWAKWSETHQVSGQRWSKTVLGIVIDANGNTLSDPSGKSYSWDFENRLTQAIVPGTGTVTFKYDPFGRRIQKSGPLGTTNYLYDGLNILETTDQNGNALARYSDALYTDEPLSELVSGTTSYFEQDGLGSIASLSNAAGALAETYTYDSFGKLLASTGTLTNPFQYTAREYDSETGQYYYRARYYNPTTGRFLSEDPVGFYGENNFYRYVGNNPTDLVDPLGLWSWTGIGAGVGGVVGGIGGALAGAGGGTVVAPGVGTIGAGVEGGVVGAAAGAVAGAAVGAAIGNAIDWFKRNSCENGKNCAPCAPPVGTISYRLDVVPPSKPHWPHTGSHYHVFQMNQNPNNCQCFWAPIGTTDGPPPPGSGPITPPGGGGFQ